MKTLLFAFLLPLSASAVQPFPAKREVPRVPSSANAPLHPLDPLGPREVAKALAVLKKEGKVATDTLFPYLMLKEPPKAEVLSWKEGMPFRREAFAELYDRKTGKLFEATVDLRAGRVASFHEVPGMHPSVMISEFDAVPPIVKADPRFKEAMKRRGITNLDDVAVDIWAYGSPRDEFSRTARLMRAIAYFKGKGTNFYARPIDGFTATVDVTERKVVDVLDTDVLPVPPDSADFDKASLTKLEGGKLRPALKPLVISQPKGVNYEVRGHEVRWNNWSFHFALHPREGLVLYLVRYNDHGTWRPVLYRASLSDMMVPYGHSDQHWTYRAAFDEGEYGIGRYSGSLDVGADVPTNSRLFDALFVDDFGKPYVTKNAVALWERDGGLLWKHMDMYNGGKNESRRGRELVIGFITTISNYDYGLNWVFKEDGSLELEAVLTGIMLSKGTTVTRVDGHDHSGDLKFGHLVAPNVVAPHHQHFFNVRLDLDVDGTTNSVAELENHALSEGKENPFGNAFEMTETLIPSEKGAARDLDFLSQRKWLVFNPSSRTEKLGYPRGFLLLPGENAAPYLQASSPLLERGGFVKHQVWFTQERDDEMYAGGPYPLQRPTSDGLPEWQKQNRSLDGQDVVLWYTFCVSHAPRPEEWPVMSVHKTGFQLLPAGFFDRNPALGVRR
jgi:primary-amine oxidase